MIPRIFHFIYLFGESTPYFGINHYISVKSNIVINDPIKVYIYTNNYIKLTRSKWIDSLLSEFGDSRINIIQCSPEDYVIGDVNMGESPYMAHVSDYLRLHFITQAGGVYSDVDSIAVNRIPDELWNCNRPVFAYENNGSHDCLCNGFFMAPVGNDVLLKWKDSFKEYRPEDCVPHTDSWTKFSVQMGYKLFIDECAPLTLIDPYLLEPYYLSYSDREDLFLLDTTEYLDDLKPYQVHLWETANKDILKILSRRYFKESNATYAQLGARYL